MKFYFCTNEISAEICGEGDAKMLYEGGVWTCRSRSYRSIEELRTGEGIPDEPCCECNRMFSTKYIEPVRSELIQSNICHSCHFWRGYVQTKDDPTHAVVDGKHYVICSEDSRATYFRGFGGAKFIVRFTDGREVVSTNLWHQGDIPKHFRDRLPNNAEFIPRGEICRS